MSVFFYWLYLIQAALLLVLAAAENGRGLALRPLAWLGAALMLAGFGVSEWISATGTRRSTTAARNWRWTTRARSGSSRSATCCSRAGLVASAISGIATVLQPRLRGEADEFTSVGFALFAWAGFLVVSAIAATNAFLPGVLWSSGPVRSRPTTAPNGTSCSTTCITCR